MPTAALRVCLHPGCSNLVTHGYCAQHKRDKDGGFERDPDTQALYNTRLWKLIRKRQLEREPWCADCQTCALWTPATEVDHIDRHQGDRERFFKGPFQSLCKSCHSRKTAREVGFTKGEGGQ